MTGDCPLGVDFLGNIFKNKENGLRRWLFFVAFIAGSSLFSWYGVRHLAVLGMVERWLEDIRVATLQPPEPQHPDIVILTITEETLARFPYRSPVDRAFIADLLTRLEQARARGILLDLLLDQPTEPDKDARLKAVLRQFSIPLMVSYGHGETALTEAQMAFQDAFVPVGSRGMANLIKDSRDQMVRWIHDGQTLPDGTFIPAVVPGLIAKLGGTPPGAVIPMAWRGQPDANTSPFRQFPAHMLPLLPAAWFTGKIVLIGADLPMTDRHRSPFLLKDWTRDPGRLDRFGSAGVVIHAHALAQLLENRPAPFLSMPWQVSLVVVAAMGGVFMVMLNIWIMFRLLIIFAIILLYWGTGFLLFQRNATLLPLLAPTLAYLLAFANSEIYERQRDRQQKKFLKDAFSKYLSTRFVDHLVNHQEFLARRAQRREMTFLFTDIEDFTTMSEKADPEVMAEQMNSYLDGVCNICLKNGGMVVDLMGDAVFAMFNAPVDIPDHAAKAVMSAREIRSFSQHFLTSPQARALGFGRTRIGIHTGIAQVGNFGSTQQFKYTPLGDAVNIAARIEGLNKFFSTDICISDASVRASGVAHIRPLGHFVLKGKGAALLVHEIPAEGKFDPDYLDRFRQAFSWLTDAAQSHAVLAAFEALAREHPEDPCAAWYLEQLRQGRDCSRVVMTSK
ncbi:MAG: adenylate/guanylate cyclase domain-containing protein [Magnetococcales bacterium]|nr:adenylate/guanylate cyclase domain-containing protein [Magnetococcales bacterium]MBF0631043.1 adenylate/guanylate cyclase domain-containing protein [Magnetococcales bacterium]